MSRTSTHSEASDSPIPGVIPESARVHGQTPDLPQADAPEPQVPAEAGPGGESRGGRFRRKAHRGRLNLYAIGAVALLVYLVALAAANTSHVKVDWVFGTGSVSLVWLVLFAAILGWLLGTLISALFRWRTRAPRAS
jgi:uncharacterized integral membrane protein